MKAQEVLSKYAAGDRNFRDASLRGANFTGQDLSGADFSGADIRSANFSNATLHNVRFTGAQAGLQRRWLAFQLVLIVILAMVTGILQGGLGFIATALFDGSNESLFSEGIYLLLLLLAYIVISLQGFTLRALGIIVGALLFVVAVIIAAAGSLEQTFLIAFAQALPVAIVGVLSVGLIVMLMGALSVAGTDLFALALVIAAAVVLTISGTVVFLGAETITFVVALALALTSWLLVLYTGWQVSRGRQSFSAVRSLGLWLCTLGGTSFCGADLSGATFAKARLINTKFNDSRQGTTQLKHVHWEGTENLNRSRLGSTLLKDNRVRRILTIPEKGYQQNLTRANLQGANLKGVTLEGAVLRQAVLNEAILESAMLKDATLTRTQAVGADFTGACLTGAMIESWEIDETTTFNNVDCQYVFLKEDFDGTGPKERRPRDPNEFFEVGGFEKFLKEKFLKEMSAEH